MCKNEVNVGHQRKNCSTLPHISSLLMDSTGGLAPKHPYPSLFMSCIHRGASDHGAEMVWADIGFYLSNVDLGILL